jgi:hypothetical protein
VRDVIKIDPWRRNLVQPLYVPAHQPWPSL